MDRTAAVDNFVDKSLPLAVEAGFEERVARHTRAGCEQSD